MQFLVPQVDESLNFIDFVNSYCTINSFNKIVGKIRLRSVEEYIMLKKHFEAQPLVGKGEWSIGKTLNIHSIKIRTDIQVPELFFLRQVSPSLFISERLRDVFLAQGLTGMWIEPADKLGNDTIFFRPARPLDEVEEMMFEDIIRISQ
jgi:hypothetical protein